MTRKRQRKGKFKCHWCDRPLEKPTSVSGRAATKDHVVARAHGGFHTVDACRACNQIKGDMSPWEWINFIAANPRWWRQYSPRLIRSPAELRNRVVVTIAASESIAALRARKESRDDA